MKFIDLLNVIEYYDGELSVVDQDLDYSLVYEKGCLTEEGLKHYAAVLNAPVTRMRLEPGDNWIEIDVNERLANEFLWGIVGMISCEDYREYFVDKVGNEDE